LPLLLDDLSTSIWYVRLIPFPEDLKGGNKVREDGGKIERARRLTPAQLRAKQNARCGKVQFAVPFVPDEACQPTAAKSG